MKTTNTAPGSPGIMTASAVAKATGLVRTELYVLHEWGAGMGAPGHYSYPDNGELTYTLKGLCSLVEALSGTGQTVAAASLAEVVKVKRQAVATAAGVTTPDGPKERETCRRWDLESEQRQEEFFGGRAA